MTKEEKCSITQKNRIVIHKGNEEKRIYKNELDTYIMLGWQAGISDKHRQQMSNKRKGIKPWNIGMSPSVETRQKISNSLKGNVGWNKGKTAEDDIRIKNGCDKANNTKRERYGNASPMYNKHCSEEHRKKISEANKGKKSTMSPEMRKIKVQKDYITKKKNGTFNTSKPENDLFEEFKKVYQTDNILRHYKCDRYPYYCDFYIPSLDLFIELNAHWTHGSKPYDPTDEFCQKQLEQWQEKAKTSQFYANAINTWTVRDVAKQKCAKENNLNYIAIYEY